jgi:hypothetical protein
MIIQNIETSELRKILTSPALEKYPDFSRFKALLDENSDIWYEAYHNGKNVFCVENEPLENTAIITYCFFILPGRALIYLKDVSCFALYKTNENQGLNVRLVIVDKSEISHEYIFPLEISDRKEFCLRMSRYGEVKDNTAPEFFD